MNKDDIERTEQYKGRTITIVWDRDPANPCEEWDMLGRMVCWHSRYNLGHEQPKEAPEEWLRAQVGADEDDERDFCALVDAFSKDNLVMPLYLYDHSGITIRTTDFGDRWDSGQVGIIFVPKAKIREEYSVKRLSAKTLQKARSVLLAEVKEYDDYLTGMVFGYVIEDEDYAGDSCYGYFGYPEGAKRALEDAKDMIDATSKPEAVSK